MFILVFNFVGLLNIPAEIEIVSFPKNLKKNHNNFVDNPYTAGRF